MDTQYRLSKRATDLPHEGQGRIVLGWLLYMSTKQTDRTPKRAILGHRGHKRGGHPRPKRPAARSAGMVV